MECIEQIRLLGVEMNDDLSWKSNTDSITKKAFGRMTLLRKLVGFGIPRKDLVLIYILFIRSKLEYCSEVWHSTITQEEIQDLDRVQKCAVRVIMGEDYEGYEEALLSLELEDLSIRRENMCLSFAKKCLSNSLTKAWFPKNPQGVYYLRNPETFDIMLAHTERFKQSTNLQRLLNENP